MTEITRAASGPTLALDVARLQAISELESIEGELSDAFKKRLQDLL